jgi:probable H4MPT-linked C1 transfer pathway protein
MKILAWDIGGANIKATFLEKMDGDYRKKTISRYLPIWREGKDCLPMVIEEIKKEVFYDVDLVGVTMTAELSDIYENKKEGVSHVLDSILQVFSKSKILVLDYNACFKKIHEAKKNYLEVAGANWVATAWLVSKFMKNCVVVDIGSTTTDIIPIADGKTVVKGKTDMERLSNGELVYTGALRTNIATLVDEVPLRGKMIGVSSEKFALSGDIHLILENISPNEYTSETADGREKTKDRAFARLARIICADSNMLKKEELISLANYIYKNQLKKISKELIKVHKALNRKINTIVVTGMGRNFLGKKASEKSGFKEIVDLADIIGDEDSISSPSFALASMLLEV